MTRAAGWAASILLALWCGYSFGWVDGIDHGVRGMGPRPEPSGVLAAAGTVVWVFGDVAWTSWRLKRTAEEEDAP